MYSNGRGNVRKKPSVSLHKNSGEKIVYSALEILNSSLPVGKMCQGLDVQSTEGYTFAGHDTSVAGDRSMIYSASGTVLNDSPAGGKISHRGNEGDVHSNEDSGFREHDNMSQNSNKSGSYIEVNLVKTGSFEDVTAEDVQSQLGQRHGNNEEALNEELMHIFEIYFQRKMEERLRGFRNRQMEWEEASRAEKEVLGNKMEKEKMEMQKHFSEAISKLTHSFSEERKQLEQCYEEQLKGLREELGSAQKRLNGKIAKDKLELREKLETDCQLMMMKEMSQEKQDALCEKSELKARFNKEKFELEKNFNHLLTEAETSLQKVRNELKESLRMEKESRAKIVDLEAKLKEERLLRHGAERELEQERAKCFNEVETLNKNEQLRSEAGALRQEIEEKNSEMKRLLEANRESNLKIRALTRHLQKRAKSHRSSAEVSVRSQESEGSRGSEGHPSNEDKASAVQGNLREIETRSVKSEKSIKVYDSKMRLTDERRRILVYVTFEEQAEQGLYRFISTLFPRKPISSTVRVLMTSDTKNEEVSSEQ